MDIPLGVLEESTKARRVASIISMFAKKTETLPVESQVKGDRRKGSPACLASTGKKWT